ncbi:MAG: cysteine desulfurase [Planctomycetota bacterium]|nr:cysteine desulfurase [Planctomycetota bacterium]
MPDRTLDLDAIRSEFPLLERRVHDQPLIYLDNAATTPRPRPVLDAVAGFETNFTANVHRAVHELSAEATDAYEGARKAVAAFINAPRHEEIVWTSGTTEAINLFANSWGISNLTEGDEILLTGMEHHANIVPWQLLRERIGVVLNVVPVDDDGTIGLDAFVEHMNDRTKLAAITWTSNVLGTVNDVAAICEAARVRGITTMLDAAQAVPHAPVDVQAVGCDAITFSGHKMYGPTGIGCLWARHELLESMPPWQGGGDMIEKVTFEQTTYNDVPWKFEAGTPNISGAIGLGAATTWLRSLDMDAVAAHEQHLLVHALECLRGIERVRIIGDAPHRAAVVSFLVDGIHPHDLGTFLDRHGVAIRTGHHCAWPLMDRFGVPATARISMGLYNTTEELDEFADRLVRVIDVFG